METFSVKRLNNIPSGLKDVDWSQAQELTSFHYPWQEKKNDATGFRALWDGKMFYFQFRVIDNDILVYHDTDNKKEVMLSERVEIFFRQNKDLSPYYCLEMDSEGRVLDYAANYYRDINFQWQWPSGHLELVVGATDDGYSVQGSITISSLKELGLWNDGAVEAGLFRANCFSLEKDQAKFRWITWVNPAMEEPDFHVPSAFGILQFEH